MTKKQRLDAEYQDEIGKVSRRIDRNFGGVWGYWIIDFSEKDLATLSQGELLDLGYECNYLADFQSSPSERLGPYGDLGVSRKDWEGRIRFKEKPGGLDLKQVLTAEGQVRPSMNCPSLAQLKHLQQFIGNFIDQVLQKDFFSLAVPPISTHLFKYPTSDKIAVLHIADRPQDLFKHNMQFFMTREFYRISRCPECKNIFLGVRDNKIYCSSRCQNTSAVRRLRQTAPDPQSKSRKPSKSSKSPNPKIKKEPKLTKRPGQKNHEEKP